MAGPRIDGFPRTRHPLYQTWYGMICRCTKPTHIAYRHYGARGIRVCDRWLASFEDFLSDVGAPPTDAHTIDRIDVNGNYEPGNCRWATLAEQHANQRRHGRAPVLVLRVSCPAHAALRAWVSANRLTQSHVARSIGTAAPVVNTWMTGKTRPDHHYRVAIERMTGISAVDWMTDKEWVIAFGVSRAATGTDSS